MADGEVAEGIAQLYRCFAQKKAHDRSALYESCAKAVAGDPAMLTFLATLPEPKRQPNLLFAAVRWLAGIQDSYTAFRAIALERRAELTDVILTRRTQTNEPARCATLLPSLAALPQPLALLEVGASAGLTLLPDRYNYDYAGYRLAGSDPAAPVMRCQPRGPISLPERAPHVVWRAGIDLDPLDVNDDNDIAWLHCLLWPGEADREPRLDAAVAVARKDPPQVIRGDLVDDLIDLATQAPKEATLVVFHSAVLVYVTPPRRADFTAAVRQLDAVWLSNESFGVLPELTNQPTPPPNSNPFLLARNGRTPIAFTDGHGSWIEWLTPQ